MCVVKEILGRYIHCSKYCNFITVCIVRFCSILNYSVFQPRDVHCQERPFTGGRRWRYNCFAYSSRGRRLWRTVYFEHCRFVFDLTPFSPIVLFFRLKTRKSTLCFYSFCWIHGLVCSEKDRPMGCVKRVSGCPQGSNTKGGSLNLNKECLKSLYFFES